MILPVLKAMRPSDVTEAELKHPHHPLEFLEVVRVCLDYCFPSRWKNTWECDVMPHQLCLGRMLIGRQGLENSASSHSAKNSLTSALHGQKKGKWVCTLLLNLWLLQERTCTSMEQILHLWAHNWSCVRRAARAEGTVSQPTAPSLWQN